MAFSLNNEIYCTLITWLIFHLRPMYKGSFWLPGSQGHQCFRGIQEISWSLSHKCCSNGATEVALNFAEIIESRIRHTAVNLAFSIFSPALLHPSRWSRFPPLPGSMTAINLQPDQLFQYVFPSSPSQISFLPLYVPIQVTGLSWGRDLWVFSPPLHKDFVPGTLSSSF